MSKISSAITWLCIPWGFKSGAWIAAGCGANTFASSFLFKDDSRIVGGTLEVVPFYRLRVYYADNLQRLLVMRVFQYGKILRYNNVQAQEIDTETKWARHSQNKSIFQFSRADAIAWRACRADRTNEPQTSSCTWQALGWREQGWTSNRDDSGWGPFDHGYYINYR